MTAGPGGPHGELRLDVRRQRDGHRVHIREQVVHVVVGPCPVPVGEFLRRLRATAPDTDEVERLVRLEDGGVDHLCPGAGAEQTDAHTADSP